MTPSQPATRWAARSSRNRGLARAITSGVVLRGVASVAPLVLIPLMLRGLGNEMFGLWATVTSVLALVAFSDLGLGSSLMTRMSHSFGRDDWPHIRLLVANAFAGAIAIGLIVVFMTTLLIWVWGDRLGSLLGVSSPDLRGAASGVAAIMLVGFAISLPLGLAGRMQFAVQRGTTSNIWTATASLATIPIAALLVARQEQASVLVAAVVGVGVLVQAVNLTSFLALGIGRKCRPDWTAVTGRRTWGLLSLGLGFAGLTLLSSTALNLDNVLIAATSGVESVAEFAPVARLFAAVGLLVTVIGVPLWAAFAEALARGDTAWVTRALHRTTLGLVSLSALAALLLVGLRDQILRFWIGQEAGASFELFAGFAVFTILLASASPLLMVQNAVHYLRAQFVGWGLFVACSAPAKVLALRHLGVESLPWVGAACLAATVLPAAVIGARVAVSRTGRLSGQPSK